MLDRIIRRNNVCISGQGDRAVMFVHGLGCDQRMWRYVAPTFEVDFKVILMDLSGCGRSDLSAFDLDRYSNLEGYAQDILEVIAALDLQDVVFVGHSVSIMLGAIASIRQPEKFSKLIMVAPSPCYLNYPPDYLGGFDREDIEELLDLMDKNYMGWASFLAPLAIDYCPSPELAQELESSFCSTDPITAKAFAKATFYADCRSLLPEIVTPCLVMQCSEDALVPEPVGEYLHHHIPKSSYIKLTATGHCPHLSQPVETAAFIRSYISASMANTVSRQI
ncbi:sigma factor SigB regulation protein RsbQ [Chamaesiphon polymorphus CCALA 037]|uniref:Sigma factor SigB regulation protein RsbQ n=1 Tax=Chamaesiphon polymorphus CCALA 037 TaxID=2107692 RepID=A0A2T1GEU5_9CYAN|nr:sigma factor SigB regulation protein RsbQ [Chamaesiphon polymorphus CCALA 037]